MDQTPIERAYRIVAYLMALVIVSTIFVTMLDYLLFRSYFHQPLGRSEFLYLLAAVMMYYHYSGKKVKL